MGENSENYTFGNRFDVVGWGAIKVSDYFSFSTSLSYFDTQKIDGVDADLNPMMMPLFNTDNSGRSQLDVGIGTNFLFLYAYFTSKLTNEIILPIVVLFTISIIAIVARKFVMNKK